jgi:hypothetical protein
MKNPTPILTTCFPIAAALWIAEAQFSPEDWPATKDPTKKVHYVVTDGGLTAPSDS